MYKISFYVPIDHAEKVKTAMFEKGGGKIGNYDCCSFEIEGWGQYRPGEGSHPFIGSKDQIERVRELKVEMVCADEYLKDVKEAMIEAHPYEEVAYNILHCFEI